MSNGGKEYTVDVGFSLDDGKPSWDVKPNPLNVEPGLQRITWNLTGPAEFNRSGGIVFPSEKNPTPWPGEPTGIGATQYFSNDDNTVKAGEPPILFHYTINVTGSDGRPYTLDPDVSNDPPGG